MADFKNAFERTLKFEDDPREPGRVTVDAGGRTRFGIAQKFHPNLPEEFFTGPAEDALAEAERIEQADYWDPLRLSEVEGQDIANKLFDMAVNMGVHQAAVLAQRAANALLQEVAQRAGSSGHAGFVRPGVEAPSAVARLAEDGAIGSKTLAAINSLDPAEYLQALRELSAQLYRHIASINPAQAGNLEGWLRRAEA
jgi:lysozyme family protein